MGPIWGRQDPSRPHVGPMNFVSGLLPLSEPMLTYHQRCSMAFNWEQFHKKCWWIQSAKCVWRLKSLPEASELNVRLVHGIRYLATPMVLLSYFLAIDHLPTSITTTLKSLILIWANILPKIRLSKCYFKLANEWLNISCSLTNGWYSLGIEKFNFNSMLFVKDYQTWLLTGWQHCCQPIRRHVRNSSQIT